MIFSVKIPEKPTGRAIKCSFDSLISQIKSAEMADLPVTRLKINAKDKAIEIEVEGGKKTDD